MPRKRRRNSDDTIRRLERKAKGGAPNDIGGAPDDIAAYWKACLRSGELPLPNFIWPSGSKVWALDKIWLDGKRVVLQPTIDSYAVWFKGPQYCRTKEEAIEIVKEKLAEILENHDIKENPDDRIRAAYRAYKADATEVNQARYWRECLRADEIPEPTKVFSETDRGWLLADYSTANKVWEIGTLPDWYCRRVGIYKYMGNQERSRVLFPSNSTDCKHSIDHEYFNTDAELEKALKEDLRKILKRYGY